MTALADSDGIIWRLFIRSNRPKSAFHKYDLASYLVGRSPCLKKKEIWELEQTAKWSHSLREKKIAIKELSFHGELAIPYLDEVMSVTTYMMK